MIIKVKKLYFLLYVLVLYIVMMTSNAFAAKYTIARGIDFNTRVKILINENNASSTPDYTIKAFLQGDSYHEDAIDISEDGDSSVLAYIENDILYYLSDDDVYLNQDASYMFDKFMGIKRIDLSTINLTKTKDTSFMFSNCKSLVEVNLDNDDILKLNSIKGMFYNCESIVNLYLFMLDTNNVTDMSELFANCINLKNIYIYPDLFKTNKVQNFKNTYQNCKSLKTNLGRPSSRIQESDYKLYSVAGDDEEPIEGLFRNYDYDYDIKDEKSNNFKTSIDKKIIEADANINKIDTRDESLVAKAKEYSKINLDKDSVFYNNDSDDVIDDLIDDANSDIHNKGIIRPDFSKSEEIKEISNNQKVEEDLEETEDVDEADIDSIDDKTIYIFVIIAIIASIIVGTLIYSFRE